MPWPFKDVRGPAPCRPGAGNVKWCGVTKSGGSCKRHSLKWLLPSSATLPDFASAPAARNDSRSMRQLPPLAAQCRGWSLEFGGAAGGHCSVAPGEWITLQEPPGLEQDGSSISCCFHGVWWSDIWRELPLGTSNFPETMDCAEGQQCWRC